MSYKNEVKIIGDVATEPRLSYVGEKSTAKVFVIVNVPETVSGKKRDNRIVVTAWGDVAEQIANECPIGTHVELTGKLNFSRYKKGDEWKDDISVVAFNVKVSESMGKEVPPPDDDDNVPF